MPPLTLMFVFAAILSSSFATLGAPCPDAEGGSLKNKPAYLHIRLSGQDLCVPVITPQEKVQLQQASMQRQSTRKQQQIAENHAMMQLRIEEIELQASRRRAELLDQHLAWLNERRAEGDDIEETAWKLLEEIGTTKTATLRHDAMVRLWQKQIDILRDGLQP